jgi:ABC-2 type transport system permease protein
MTWQHFRTLIWLRGRLFRNRMRRAGKLNAILTQILKTIAVIISVALFFVVLGLGVWLLPKATPDVVLYLWTAVTAAFLFSWLLGVMAELQRSEVLSIEKLFHFPISPSSAFLVNYLSSLVSMSLILFFPAMLGLSIASVIALGPWMLISLPLLLGFMLMVTAVTYQLRGWLAILMVNKRRRRTIVAIVTTGTILLSQSGNLINLFVQGSHKHGASKSDQSYRDDFSRLELELRSGKITPQQFQTQNQSLVEAQKQANERETREFLRGLTRYVSIADLVLPPGWLAFGVHRAAEHEIWPGLVGTLLLGAIAAASLRRSYHSTVRFYLGDYRADRSTADAPAVAVAVAPAPVVGSAAPALAAAQATEARPDAPAMALPVGMVSKSLPWVPEQAAATGFATLRSLLRAPEVKMMLLSPFILGGVFLASRFARGSTIGIPIEFRPMMALGIVVTLIVSISPLFQNQFGFDRSAFRTFVLCPAPRWQILLGKNLALAPIVLVAGAIFLGALEFLFPLRPTDFLATFVELLSAYLIVCLVGNQMSILLPSAVRPGSMRSSSDTKTLRVLARLGAMLGQLVAFVPLAIPIGFNYLVEMFPWGRWVPAYLIAALAVSVATIIVYRSVLDYQGGLLQRRELRILEAVTAKED